MLSIQQLTLIKGQRLLCQDLNLNILAGEAWLILGMNGSGKSTLLSTLAAWQTAHHGKILLQGQSLADWPARQRAQQIAWLHQHDNVHFPMSVMAKVLSGCQTRLSAWQWENDHDFAQATTLLKALDLAHLADHDLATLSGGECRRASLAAILMQQADVLLLDEPLSQLDIHHQQYALKRLKQEREQGKSLLVVSHDPNHARLFATHALLLFGDGRWLAGTTAEVLTVEHLTELYQYPVRALTEASGTWFVADSE